MISEVELYNEVAASNTNVSFDVSLKNHADSILKTGWIMGNDSVPVSTDNITTVGAQITKYGLDNATSVDFFFREVGWVEKYNGQTKKKKRDSSSRSVRSAKGTDYSLTNYVPIKVNIKRYMNSTHFGCNISGLLAPPRCVKWFDEKGICLDEFSVGDFEWNSTVSHLDTTNYTGNYFWCNFTLEPSSVTTYPIELKGEEKYLAKTKTFGRS